MSQYTNLITNDDSREKIDKIFLEENKFYDIEQSEKLIDNKNTLLVNNFDKINSCSNNNNNNINNNNNNTEQVINFIYIFIISFLILICYINKSSSYILIILVITLIYIFIKFILK